MLIIAFYDFVSGAMWYFFEKLVTTYLKSVTRSTLWKTLLFVIRSTFRDVPGQFLPVSQDAQFAKKSLIQVHDATLSSLHAAK